MAKDKKKAKQESDVPLYRQRDRGKVVKGCDGFFEPSDSGLRGPMRPGKTREDYMAKENRPRVAAANTRLERMNASAHSED